MLWVFLQWSGKVAKTFEASESQKPPNNAVSLLNVIVYISKFQNIPGVLSGKLNKRSSVYYSSVSCELWNNIICTLSARNTRGHTIGEIQLQSLWVDYSPDIVRQLNPFDLYLSAQNG